MTNPPESDAAAEQLVDPAVLRAVMASYPTGVTIVTAAAGDQLAGMAMNSFTSVSLDPPLVLVCPQTGARTSETAKRSGRFAIHILRHDQVAAARAFVGRDAPRFAAVEHELDEHGTPILKEWLALIVCSVYGVFVAGDHEILLGRVERCEREEAAPLLFHESALRMLPHLPPLKASGPLLSALENDGEYDFELPDSLMRINPPDRR